MNLPLPTAGLVLALGLAGRSRSPTYAEALQVYQAEQNELARLVLAREAFVAENTKKLASPVDLGRLQKKLQELDTTATPAEVAKREQRGR